MQIRRAHLLFFFISLLPLFSQENNVIREKDVIEKKVSSSSNQEISIPFPESDPQGIRIMAPDLKDDTSSNEIGAKDSPPLNTGESISHKETSSKQSGQSTISSESVVNQNPKKLPPKKKKKKQKDGADIAYKLGKLQLASGNLEIAESEFSKATDDDAKIELILLKKKEGKLDEAVKLIESIADLEKKQKGRIKLANSMADLNKANSSKVALDQFFQVITDEENPLAPAAMWGVSRIFYLKNNFKSSLEYLTRIILDFPDSEFLDDAYYLCGRIYETRGDYHNSDKAKSFYKLFLKNMDKENFKTSIYSAEVKRRLRQL